MNAGESFMSSGCHQIVFVVASVMLALSATAQTEYKLGIAVQDVPQQLTGAKVTFIEPGRPLAETDLKPDDYVTAVNGSFFSTATEFSSLLDRHCTNIILSVFRSDAPELTVTFKGQLIHVHENHIFGVKSIFGGHSYCSTGLLVTMAPYQHTVIKVQGVEADSAAERAGLKTGDLILNTSSGELGFLSTDNLGEKIRHFANEVGTQTPLKLEILREGKLMSATFDKIIGSPTKLPATSLTEPDRKNEIKPLPNEQRVENMEAESTKDSNVVKSASPLSSPETKPVPLQPNSSPYAAGTVSPPASTALDSVESVITKLQTKLRSNHFDDLQVTGEWNKETENAVDKIVADLQQDKTTLWSHDWTGATNGAQWSLFENHLKTRISDLQSAINDVNEFIADIDYLALQGVYTEPELCGFRHKNQDRFDALKYSFLNGLEFDFGAKWSCSGDEECLKRARFLLSHFLTEHGSEKWNLIIAYFIGTWICPIGLFGAAVAFVSHTDRWTKAFAMGAGADLIESVTRIFGEYSTNGTIQAPLTLFLAAVVGAAVAGGMAVFSARSKRRSA